MRSISCNSLQTSKIKKRISNKGAYEAKSNVLEWLIDFKYVRFIIIVIKRECSITKKNLSRETNWLWFSLNIE